MYATNLIYIQT